MTAEAMRLKANIAWHFGFQYLHEFRLHVFVFIRNIEDDNFLSFQVSTELLCDFVPVRFLHNYDHMSQLDKLRRNGCCSVIIQPGRHGFNT